MAKRAEPVQAIFVLWNDHPAVAIDLRSDAEYEALAARLEKISKRAKMIWEDGDPQPNHGVGGAEVERRRRVVRVGAARADA